ncbi:MAG: PHP domain-containing protein [Vulcanimicrobiaceae bacterium]
MDPSWRKGSRTLSDPRIIAIPDIHGHAKGEHRPFAEERPIAYSPRMLFLWFYHACRRNSPRFLMVSDHVNYLTFEDPGAVHTVRRALKLAHAGDLYGAAETAGVDVAHAAVVSEGLRRGMRFSIGAEVDNDPRSRPDAQNIVDAMRPDGMIRSVHFLAIDHPEKGAEWQWPFDNPEFSHLFDVVGTARTWELYMERLLDDIEKLPGHVVGHFYVPAIFGHWPDLATLERYEDQLLEACLARGMAVEVNTRFLYRENSDEQRAKMLDAYKRLIRKAKAKGVGIAVGSDAHSPRDQGGAFETILQMLDDCDVNDLVFPVAGRLLRVVLRATKEHIEQQKQPEPTQAGSSISGFSRAELGLPEDLETREIGGKVRSEGAKKRGTGPARTTKKPAAVPTTPKASSRRSAESAASSSKAKEAKAVTPPAKSPKDAPAKKPAKTAAPAKIPVKAPGKKAASTAKPAAAKPAVKKAVTKTPAKKAAAKPAPKPAKVPAKKASPAKSPAKKAIPKKVAAKKAAPVKKTVASKSAVTAKKVAGKKALPKKPISKPAAKARKPAPKIAAKPKAATKKKAPAAKKKAPPKRR